MSGTKKEIKMPPTKQEILSLDSLLELGGHQFRNYFSIGIACLLVTAFAQSFILTTSPTKYRCFVPECEDISNTTYKTNWLQHATKIDSKGIPDSCQRYAPISYDGSCNSSTFDKDTLVDCEAYIWETDEIYLLREFNLECKNKWKLSFVGFIDGIGALFGSPICAFLSDKFGRKKMICIFSIPVVILGFIRSFSVSYEMYVVLDFINDFLTFGIYESSFVLCMELVGFRHRVWANIVFSIFGILGYTLLGVLGILTQHWKWFLRILYAPGLIFFGYYWIAPESVRWLLIQNKIPEATKVVQDIIRGNPQAKTIDVKNVLEHTKKTDSDVEHVGYLESLKLTCSSWTLLIRLFHSSVCWMGIVLLFYGSVQHSVALSGDKHINYLATIFAQIPGTLVSAFSIKTGYQTTMLMSLILCSVVFFAFYFISIEFVTLRMILYLIGMIGVTSAYAVLFMSTVTMFPTPLRQSLLAFCYMIGRVGQIVAPLIILLGSEVPPLIFGIVALLVACLAFFLPETYHLELPDTVKQAEDVETKTDR